MASELKRTLGLTMLVFYGTGMILGAGIYSVIGRAAEVAGESLWLSFLFAAVAAALTAFSYAELSTMFPKSGSEYVYLSQAFKQKKWVAGAAGTVMAFSGSATAATVAIAFSGYFGKFAEGYSPILVAGIVLSIFSVIAIVGIQASGWVNIVFTMIEVAGLGIIIYLGVTSEKFGDVLSSLPGPGVLQGTALVVFSYFGFENIVNLAEESREPEKTLPKAIFISLGVSTILYLLVSLAAMALLSPKELGASDAALMTAAGKSSVRLGNILGGIALFSTANTALISLVGASRILYGMAAHSGDKHSRALPAFFAKTLLKRKTPWVASIVVLTAALLLLPIAKVETLASVSSLATMIVFIGVNSALIALRRSDPRRTRPFRVPISIRDMPVLPVLGIAICLVILFQFSTIVYIVGGTFLLVTVLSFYFRERYFGIDGK